MGGAQSNAGLSGSGTGVGADIGARVTREPNVVVSSARPVRNIAKRMQELMIGAKPIQGLLFEPLFEEHVALTVAYFSEIAQVGDSWNRYWPASVGIRTSLVDNTVQQGKLFTYRGVPNGQEWKVLLQEHNEMLDMVGAPFVQHKVDKLDTTGLLENAEKLVAFLVNQARLNADQAQSAREAIRFHIVCAGNYLTGFRSIFGSCSESDPDFGEEGTCVEPKELQNTIEICLTQGKGIGAFLDQVTDKFKAPKPVILRPAPAPVVPTETLETLFPRMIEMIQTAWGINIDNPFAIDIDAHNKRYRETVNAVLDIVIDRFGRGSQIVRDWAAALVPIMNLMSEGRPFVTDKDPFTVLDRKNYDEAVETMTQFINRHGLTQFTDSHGEVTTDNKVIVHLTEFLQCIRAALPNVKRHGNWERFYLPSQCIEEATRIGRDLDALFREPMALWSGASMPIGAEPRRHDPPILLADVVRVFLTAYQASLATRERVDADALDVPFEHLSRFVRFHQTDQTLNAFLMELRGDLKVALRRDAINVETFRTSFGRVAIAIYRSLNVGDEDFEMRMWQAFKDLGECLANYANLLRDDPQLPLDLQGECVTKAIAAGDYFRYLRTRREYMIGSGHEHAPGPVGSGRGKGGKRYVREPTPEEEEEDWEGGSVASENKRDPSSKLWTDLMSIFMMTLDSRMDIGRVLSLEGLNAQFRDLIQHFEENQGFFTDESEAYTANEPVRAELRAFKRALVFILENPTRFSEFEPMLMASTQGFLEAMNKVYHLDRDYNEEAQRTLRNRVGQLRGTLHMYINGRIHNGKWTQDTYRSSMEEDARELGAYIEQITRNRV